jgi:hypothetical protein
MRRVPRALALAASIAASVATVATLGSLGGCSGYHGDLLTICEARAEDLPKLQLRTERGRKLHDTLIRSTSKERFSTLGAELQREGVERCPLLREWSAQ